jgi:CBS domain-containing protein
MFSLRVKEVMERRKFVKAPSNITVGKAARLMAKKRVGALLVVDGARLQGIFTERDVLFRVVAAQLDPEATLVGEVMTREPKTIGPADSFGHALAAMHQGGFRHLPVVLNGAPIGIISNRSALDPELVEFRCEGERRRHLIGR